MSICLPRFPRQHALWVVLLVLMGAAACQPEPPPADFVARVGDRYLTREELRTALELVSVQDSTEASQQIIERWLTNELLVREARRRGLRDEPEVQRLLAENERSVLVSALLTRIYEDEALAPTAAETRAYFEQHQEQLRLREPFVRLRYLSTPSPDTARTARQQLQQDTRAGIADSTWMALTERYAAEPEAVQSLAQSYFPESHVLNTLPTVRAYLSRLQPGEIAPLIAEDGRYHLLQLAGRVPAGSLPEMGWIQDELAQRLVIQARKQMYARQVQRLRNEAIAREALELR